MKAEPICIIDSNGTKRWHNKEGLYHREDGPAVEYLNGTKYWYLNGKFHREAGPAVEYPDGTKYWYLNGVPYTEQEYYRELVKQKLKTPEEVFVLML